MGKVFISLSGCPLFASAPVLLNLSSFLLAGIKKWRHVASSSRIVVQVTYETFEKVWDLTKLKLKTNHLGHSGYINTISVSPDGSLAASGGKDGITMLWDLNEGKHLYSLEAGDVVNALVFSPNRYWLCAATTSCIKIFDLESK